MIVIVIIPHTYLHTDLPTYLPPCLPTYIHTYLPTYIPTYYIPTTYLLHTYYIPTTYLLHTYYIPTTYLHNYIPTYILHTYIPTYISHDILLLLWLYIYISLYPCIFTISPYDLLLNALYKPSPKSPEVQEWLKARRTRWRWMSSKRSLEMFLGTEKDGGQGRSGTT